MSELTFGICEMPCETTPRRRASSQAIACLAPTAGSTIPPTFDPVPACNSKERVSTNVVPVIPPVQAAADTMSENAVEQERVEQEREEFLKQFKSQLFAAHAEVANSPTVCSLEENHAQGP